MACSGEVARRWGKCWLELCRADVGFWPKADIRHGAIRRDTQHEADSGAVPQPCHSLVLQLDIVSPAPRTSWLIG